METGENSEKEGWVGEECGKYHQALNTAEDDEIE
jgi:hypothetical protein